MPVNVLRTLPIWILMCVSLNQLSGQPKRIQPSCPMNVIIALDFSGSERAYIGQIQNALYALTSKFELNEATFKVGIITFDRGARVVLPLTGDTKRLDEIIAALDIPSIVYATDIHAAIRVAQMEFRIHSENSIPKYFVLISDGDPHAHSRGYGFQADLVNMDRLKKGNPEAGEDPIHVFTLYTGRLSPFHNRFGEDVRLASIRHMQELASDEHSFFYYEDYPMLVELIERLSNCL